MKKSIQFILVLMLSILFIPLSNGQELWGFLYDKDGNPIKNEEVILEIQICKNGDSLFTKKDTVMTDQSLGAFGSDMSKEFKASNATNKDTISYSLKFTYGGETITTPKKVWRVQLSSRNSGHALESDHALFSDESGHALMADEAMTAGNALLANHAMTADDASNAVNAQTAVNAETAYWANVSEEANNALRADFAVTAEQAEFANAAWAYQPVNMALPNDGDQGILIGTNSGGDINFQNVDLSQAGEGINILQNSGGTFSFTNLPPPNDNTVSFVAITNVGSTPTLSPIEFINDLPGAFNINDNGGGIEILPDAISNSFNNSNPGTYNVKKTINGEAQFVPLTFGTDTSTDITNLNTVTGQLQAVGQNTSARINFQNTYGGMFVGPVCADNFFQNKRLIHIQIENEKSGNALAKNNGLWQETGNGNSGFIKNLKSIYPELVREIEMEIDGKSVTDSYVSYIDLIPLLSKAINEQNDIIDSQQEQIDELKAMVELLIENSKK